MPISKAQRGAEGSTGHVRKTPEMHKLLKLNGHLQTDVFYLLLEVLAGEPKGAMEAANQLIDLPASKLPVEPLSRILLDARYRDWSRIAAAYVLGFLPLESGSEHRYTLRKVLSDQTNSIRVRSHVVESLGNLRDADAVRVLKERLLDSAESTEVRKWCIYALSEIPSNSSKRALDAFTQTNPQGVLAKELSAVGQGRYAEVIEA